MYSRYTMNSQVKGRKPKYNILYIIGQFVVCNDSQRCA